MGLFQKLFSKILGPRVASSILRPTIEPAGEQVPSIEEMKERIQAENAEGFKELRRKIAAGKDEMLEGIKRKAQTAGEAITEELKRRGDEAVRRNPWYSFTHLGVPLVRGLNFTSSNVSRVIYDIEHESLYVTYASGHRTDGRTYRYWTVTYREAAALYNSASKGRYVWDNLRIRGTLLGHRKNYALVEAMGDMPNWTESAAQIRAHDINVGVQSGAAGPHQVLQLGATGAVPAITAPYAALGKFQLSSPMLNKANQKAGISQDLLQQLIQNLEEART